jgi:hypothetical protein
MSSLRSKPFPNAVGLRPIHEPMFRSFLRGQLITVVERYAAISKQSRFASLIALKIMAAEMSEADLCTPDSELP